MDRSLALCAFLFLMISFGCRERHQGARIPGLANPDSMVVYSLHPWPIDANESQDVEVLDRYRVLGKVEVDDPSQREAITALVQQAIENPGKQYKCFDPRHAVVAHENGQRFQIVICFECGNYSLNGEGLTPAIGSQPKRMLNQILTEAGVELSKE